MASGLRERLRRSLAPRRHTAFLTAIVFALVVRPLIGEGGTAALVFSVSLLVLMLAALYAIQVDEAEQAAPGRGRAGELGIRRLGWALAAVAVAERIAVTLAPGPGRMRAGTIGWRRCFCFVTWAQLRSVLRQKDVSGETISMAVSVYLLLGLTWGLFYALLFQLQPQAFNLGAAAAETSADSVSHLFPIFVYFSLTTLSTI